MSSTTLEKSEKRINKIVNRVKMENTLQDKAQATFINLDEETHRKMGPLHSIRNEVVNSKVMDGISTHGYSTV